MSLSALRTWRASSISCFPSRNNKWLLSTWQSRICDWQATGLQFGNSQKTCVSFFPFTAFCHTTIFFLFPFCKIFPRRASASCCNCAWPLFLGTVFTDRGTRASLQFLGWHMHVKHPFENMCLPCKSVCRFEIQGRRVWKTPFKCDSDFWMQTAVANYMLRIRLSEGGSFLFTHRRTEIPKHVTAGFWQNLLERKNHSALIFESNAIS